jgi:hypothetical protein
MLSSTLALGGLAGCHEGVAIDEQPLVSDSGVLIPGGQALAHPLTLEAGITLTKGAWAHDGTESHEPENFAYVAPATLGEALELPVGSIFIGDVIIPADVSLQPGSILPGARVLSSEGANAEILPAAAVVPPSAELSAELNALPPESLLTGARETLEVELPVPAGSLFPNGTRTPDGDVIAEALPDAFVDVVASEATTLPPGTLMLGGMQLPEAEGITIDEPINAFVGSYRLPEDAVIPAPGIGLPAGTRLDAAVLIPRGATFLIDSTLPAETQLGLGYLEPPMESPPELVMTGASTLGAETQVARGTALLGDALIPEGVGELSAPLFLPGGSQLGRGIALPEQQRLGMIIPPTASLSTAEFSPANLPEQTLMLGYADVLSDEVTFPAGTDFLSGYLLPDGTVVEASQGAEATTLPSGSVLLGGAALPDETVGNYLTFTADFALPGAAMIPADDGVEATVQGPDGLTIPVKSQSISGTTGGYPQDADFGEVLAEPLHMPPGAYYCKAAEITDASGFAKVTTARIEYQINGEAQTQIEIATDFQFTNIVQTFMPEATSGWVQQEVTGLDPETTYYFRITQQGCGMATAIIQGFRTTNDPCGGDFELVSPGDVYDGWDGRFGTANESALHVSQMKINPADNRLYIAASKQSDATAILYRSTADFLGIQEAGLVVGNAAVRNSTAIGFQNFGEDLVYLSFKDNANRGFSLYRWALDQLADAISVASADGNLGGISASDREGFGDADNVWVTAMVGAELSSPQTMYVSTRTSGRLYMANGQGPNGALEPGDSLDFTDCAAGDCGQNGGAGFIWESGTNNIGALSYVNASSTAGMFIGVGNEDGTGAALFFMPESEIGSTTPTVSPVDVPALAGEVVVDIHVLNEDLVVSLADGGGGKAWRCGDYEGTDCSEGANWELWVDFADGTGLSEADASNISVPWVRQMPTSGRVYLGTENAGGAQIWSAEDATSAFDYDPQSGCAGFGDASLIASPTAETMHNAERNVDILYLALHQYALYDQADTAANNVYVYRRMEEL